MEGLDRDGTTRACSEGLRLSNEESRRLTRECIEEATVTLMAERGLDRIAISEIVRKAGVSRMAFYRNYESKEDVLASMASGMLDELNGIALRAIAAQSERSLYMEAFGTARERSRMFGLILDAGLEGNLFDVSGYLAGRYPDAGPAALYALTAWEGMLRSVMVSWYKGGMREDAGEMADLCCRLAAGVAPVVAEAGPSFAVAGEVGAA